MVKKLLKHEFAYYLRSMLPIYAILLLVATAGRVIQFFEADNTVYDILFAIAMLTYVGAIIAVCVMTLVFTITRFYRNLFTSEGYLSFSLPVTPTQHISTKLIAAIVTHAASFIVTLVSVCIITAGDVLAEIVKAIAYICNQAPVLLALAFDAYTEAQWSANLWLFAIEFVLLVLTTTVYAQLLYYTCITVGQLFNKNRALAAVGAYGAYYVATESISTVVVVVAQFLPWEAIGENFFNAPIPYIHAMLLGYLVLNLLLSAALFFVSHTIIRRRLNLE
ncbi:MAG: hypothetical protein IJB26_06200 [Clostridia bacterium]|nr:hypothetical protein [Clostridia bacterium]